jgi:hypothetical protein
VAEKYRRRQTVEKTGQQATTYLSSVVIQECAGGKGTRVRAWQGKVLTGRRQDAGLARQQQWTTWIGRLGSDDVRTGRMRRMMSTMLNQVDETS